MWPCSNSTGPSLTPITCSPCVYLHASKTNSELSSGKRPQSSVGGRLLTVVVRARSCAKCNFLFGVTRIATRLTFNPLLKFSCVLALLMVVKMHARYVAAVQLHVNLCAIIAVFYFNFKGRFWRTPAFGREWFLDADWTRVFRQ